MPRQDKTPKKKKKSEEMTMRVHRSEFTGRLYPFSLTDKNDSEIPVKIVKELVTDGYAVMLISTVN